MKDAPQHHRGDEDLLRAGRRIEQAASKDAWWRHLSRADVPTFIFLATAVTYLPTLGNAYIYDDYKLIFAHPAPASLGDVAALFLEPHYSGLPYYRPLTRVTFMLQKALHSVDSALWYHLFNLLLATGLALATWFFMRAKAVGFSVLTSALAALAVAVHPVTSSAVHAITGREALLAALFAVVAVGLYMKRTAWSLAGAHVCFALGLLSREVAITIPVLFFLSEFAEDPPPRRDWKAAANRLAPAAAIVAVYFVLRHVGLSSVSAGSVGLTSDAALFPLSWLFALDRIALPPWQLGYEPTKWSWLRPALLPLLAAIVAGAAMLARQTSGTRRRLALFGLAWFAVTFLPTSNILNQEAPFAERHLVLPLVGLVLLVASGAESLAKPRLRAMAAAAAVLAIAVFGLTSYHRAAYFQNDFEFYRQWLRTSPDSARAESYLGTIYVQQGLLDDAELLLQSALLKDRGNALVLGNLGYIALTRGDMRQAEEYLNASLAANPISATSLNSLATVLRRTGREAEGLELLARARLVDPWHPDTNYNLGVIELERGDPLAALHRLNEVVRVRPLDGRAWGRIASIHQALGEDAPARDAYERATALDIDRADIYNNFGVFLAQRGELDRAAEMFRKALSIDPQNESALQNIRRITGP